MKTKVYTKSTIGKIFKTGISWGEQEKIPFAHICRDALEQNAVGMAVQETFYFLNNSSETQEKKLFLFVECNWRTISKAEAILLNRSQELLYKEEEMLQMPNTEFFYSDIRKTLIAKDDNVFIFECSWN